MALSAGSLDEIIKPEKRDSWCQVKRQWFPRTDDSVQAAYDKRTPGLN